MTSQNAPCSLRELHRFLAHRPDTPRPARHLLIRNESDGITTVTDADQPAPTSVKLPISPSHAEQLLRVMLRHHPVPHTLNGEPTVQSYTQSQSQISVMRYDPDLLPAGSATVEYITDVLRYPPRVVIDGLAYDPGWPEVPPRPLDNTGIRQTLLNDVIVATPVDWPQPHQAPVHIYTVSHHANLGGASPAEQDDSTFTTGRAGPVIQPGPALLSRIQDLADTARAKVQDHASQGHYRLLREDERSQVHQAWSQIYDSRAILVKPNGVPAILDPGIPGQVAYAIARSMHAASVDNIVPVHHRNQPVAGHEPYRISCPTVTITTTDGVSWDTAGNDPAVGQRLGQSRPTAITANLTITPAQDTDPPYHRHVPLDFLPIGTAENPGVILAVPCTPTPEQLQQFLTHAFCATHHVEQDRIAEIENRMSTLAQRTLAGELAGFQNELNLLARSFNPSSQAPQHPVTAIAPNGARLVWHPPRGNH